MVEGRDTKRFRSGDNKKKLVDYIKKGDAKKTNAIGEGEGLKKKYKKGLTCMKKLTSCGYSLRIHDEIQGQHRGDRSDLNSFCGNV